MKEFLGTALGRTLTYVICYVLCFGVIAAGVGIANAVDTPIIGAILACVIAGFGWRFINFITPTMFIWLPLAGWVIYFIIKFIVSFTLGIFITPYHMAKAILDKE